MRYATVVSPERPYDLVVFGATGFTGRLVAEYLAARPPLDPPLRWAVAGRDLAKLEALRKALGRKVGLIVADAGDPTSLARMAEVTRVVATTVGPYIRYGDAVVRACVDAGTDYADITGEPEFVDRTIVRYHDVAEAKGVRVVNCCGFDSVPHDLGAFYTVRQLPPSVPIRVEGFVRTRGGLSAGTWTSALDAFARTAQTRRARRARMDTQIPLRGERKVASTRPQLHYEPRLHGWLVPLPTIDSDVVLRSARIDPRYGPEFRYGHYLRVRRFSTLVAGAAAVGGVYLGARLAPTRALLRRAKGAGEGPSPEARARARFEVLFHGQGGGRTVRCRVAGGDPGYDETAKMLAESALCLARDRKRLPGPCGVVTPAAAMGDALLVRLQAAGLIFETLE